MSLFNNITLALPSITFCNGAESGDVEVDCCLWGALDKPLIVVMGGISASRWALDAPTHKQPGWWRGLIHEQGCLNLNDFSFLTFEYFAYADRITNPPLVSTRDQARLLRCIQQTMNLPQFHAVIGASYGGMVSLAFAAQHPDSLRHVVCLAAADRNSVKSQALRHIQRQIMALGERDNHSIGTQQNHTALARALAMLGYRSEAELESRFQHHDPSTSLQQVTSYLTHHGDQFAQKFSASRYAQLSLSIDHHQVDVSQIKANGLLVGITSDQLVPTEFIEQMQQKFTSPCQTQWLDSHCGHDGFLLETDAINHLLKSYFREYKHDYIEPNSRCASGY